MEWYHDDGLWSGFSTMMFSDKRAATVARTVASSPVFDLPPGSRVLDLCCGPGLYVAPLAAQGHDVTGVDLNRPMLEAAARRCDADGVKAELVEGDMLTFVRPGEFDVALSMFSSFGYFDDEADDLRVLQNLHDSLVPGGRLVIEVFGKEFLATQGLAPRVVDHDGETVVVRNTVRDDWTRLRTDWTKVRDGEVTEAHVDSRLFSAAELKRALTEVGFRDPVCSGGFDRRPYDVAARTLLVECVRP